VDQNLNSNQNEFLWTLLANPADDTRLYAYNLRRLVDDYPQSGILQALMAHASEEKNLKQASAYFNAKSLFKLINAPTSLAAVTDEKIVKLNGGRANGQEPKEEVDETVNANEELAIPEQHIDMDPRTSGTYFEEHSMVEIDPSNPLHATDNHPSVDPEVTFSSNEERADGHTATEVIDVIDRPSAKDVVAAVQEVEPSALNAEHKELVDANVDEVKERPEPAVGDNLDEATDLPQIPEQVAEDQKKEPEKTIADETSDRIINVENADVGPEIHQSSLTESEEAEQPETATPKETGGDKYQLPAINDVEDKLIVGNIAATDFFMFDRAFGENKEPDNRFSVPHANAAEKQQALLSEDKEHHDVSKYNDEKMPYTFMWWLDKTRREHAGIHQPYAKPEANNSLSKVKNVADELQQQYFENIFHITSVDDLDKHTAPKVFNFGMKPKEQVIIERFIKEEPQIKPQSSDKLDNENKAKKSSEDREELVTETLAGIYTDQMLYHKAIASYKKLMLKYPEKSRYFAAKIEQLEKKTN
jgi:hypothetical protein